MKLIGTRCFLFAESAENRDVVEWLGRLGE